MRAGQLRHIAVIKRRQATQSASGAVTTAETDVATVRAKIKPVSGRQVVEGEKNNAETSYIVTLRGGVTVLPSDVIEINAKRYEVIADISDPGIIPIEYALECRVIS